jgi:hypothetical protein
VDESSRDGDYLHSELNARPFETSLYYGFLETIVCEMGRLGQPSIHGPNIIAKRVSWERPNSR